MFLLKPHALSLYGRSHCWFPTPVLRFSPHTEHGALKSLWRPLRRYVYLWCSLNSCLQSPEFKGAGRTFQTL